MKDRLFSDAELADMGKPTYDRLMEALERGDLEGAKGLAKRMHAEGAAMHDLYRDKAAALQSFIATRYGEKALEEALVESARAWWLPILARLPKGREGLKARMRMFISGLRGHLQPLRITEDDEKVTVQMHPCGSGGRLIREGRYEGPDALYTLRTPGRLTYGRPDMPVYCAHEAPMEMLDVEKHGRPFMVVEPGTKLGTDPCTFVLYKKESDVPARYFERLGMQRSGAKEGNSWD